MNKINSIEQKKIYALIYEASQLPGTQTDAGNISWNKIQEQHPDLWKKLTAITSPKSIVSMASRLKARGLLKPVVGQSASGAATSGEPHTAGLPVVTLHKNGVKTYSAEIKSQALARIQAGEKLRDVAKALNIPAPSIYNWIKLQERAKINREKPPVAAPAPTLNFCPNCSFPIGSVIKAVNAIHTLKK